MSKKKRKRWPKRRGRKRKHTTKVKDARGAGQADTAEMKQLHAMFAKFNADFAGKVISGIKLDHNTGAVCVVVEDGMVLMFDGCSNVRAGRELNEEESLRKDIDDTQSTLLLANVGVPRAVLADWSPQERVIAKDWAEPAVVKASGEVEHVTVPKMPVFLKPYEGLELPPEDQDYWDGKKAEADAESEGGEVIKLDTRSDARKRFDGLATDLHALTEGDASEDERGKVTAELNVAWEALTVEERLAVQEENWKQAPCPRCDDPGARRDDGVYCANEHCKVFGLDTAYQELPGVNPEETCRHFPEGSELMCADCE